MQGSTRSLGRVRAPVVSRSHRAPVITPCLLSLVPMSLAPVTSPRPPVRPDLSLLDRLHHDLAGTISPELAEAASAQALLLFFWFLVLTSLAIWARRRAAAGNLAMFGSWKRHRTSADFAADRPCQWKVGATRMASGAQKWTCELCGRDGFSTTREPPEGCNWTG